MSNAEKRLQELLDRDEIERLLIRYCNALDSGDTDSVADCFAEDGGWAHRPGEGREQLRARFKGAATTDADGEHQDAAPRRREADFVPIDDVEAAQHIVSNVEIALAGDTASSFCAARVYLLGTRDDAKDEQFVLIRGITYTDKLVRTAEGWKIKERQHQLVWMTRGPAVEGAQVSGSR